MLLPGHNGQPGYLIAVICNDLEADWAERPECWSVRSILTENMVSSLGGGNDGLLKHFDFWIRDHFT